MKKMRAVLTPAEDKAWVFSFCYFIDMGLSDAQADKLAWRDVQREFPRLRGFSGCEPGIGKPAGPKWGQPPFGSQ